VDALLLAGSGYFLKIAGRNYSEPGTAQNFFAEMTQLRVAGYYQNTRL